MTLAGWVIMLLSVGLVLTIFGFSLWLTLTVPHPEEKLHGFEGSLPDPETETDSTGPKESP